MAWKLKDSEAHNFSLQWLIDKINKTNKVMWNKLKSQYEHTNMASKVAISKRLTQLHY